MTKKLMVAVVIPSWNGEAHLRQCLDSVLGQSLSPHVIVVDNGSVDSSVAIVEQEYPDVELIKHNTNKGYAGGVNPGFQLAIDRGYAYVAPFNNDAVADKHWLSTLVQALQERPDYGAAMCKLLGEDGSSLDSTGDYYTVWGLPYPRGRGETDVDAYDTATEIFAASGGASLYRVAMLKQIGLLDEDFFAYYEDVDLSFRAQWAGWKVVYVPGSIVYHATSSTSKRMQGTDINKATPTSAAKHGDKHKKRTKDAAPPINGFVTYQTMKNLPMLLWKNVPARMLPGVLARFSLVYASFFVAAIQRGQLSFALRGAGKALVWWPRKLAERRRIMKGAQAGSDYITSIMTYDLPPNARRLRNLRNLFTGRSERSNNDSTIARQGRS